MATNQNLTKMSVDELGHVFIPEFDRGINEIVFGESPADGDLDYEVEITAFVAFQNVEAFRDSDAMHVLRTIADEVERVIGVLEAECRRIGLIA
jgi:hypothetical protein